MSSFLNLIERFIGFVTTRRSRWYLLTYVAAIPLFGLIYDNQPAGFYASYARFEKGGEADAVGAAKLVQSALARQVRSTDSRPHADFGSWKLDVPTFSGVRTEDGPKLAFWVNVTLRRREGAGETLHAFSVPAVMTSLGRWNNGRTDGARKDFRYIELDLAQLDQFEKIIPDVPNLSKGIFQELWKFEVSQEEDNSLIEFFTGISGDPTKVTGSFGRMCYLSAMIITTVGFGDIVPIAPLTRGLVGLEALSGIILIGLFLNGIASRALRRTNSP